MTRRLNLYETAADLKIKLKLNRYFGVFEPNANIPPGAVIPVLLKDPNNNETYLHSMKWGIDIFGTGNRLTHNARADNIHSKTWKPLIERGQRCIVICRGFYFWHSTEILDVKRRKKMMDKQPYYVQPYGPTEGEFFFIAGLYQKKRINQGCSYSVVTLTQSSAFDDKYSGYVQRIPLFLRYKDIAKWLDERQSIYHLINQQQKIKTQPFIKVGLWVNDTTTFKTEYECLRGRDEWDRDIDAQSIGLEDADFPFAEIEEAALKQNKAQKLGKQYKGQNVSWDHLKHHGVHNIMDESDDNELKMEEEYNTNMGDMRDGRKRKYGQLGLDDIDNDEEGEDNLDGLGQEPPTKKQRIDLNANGNENGDEYTFDDEEEVDGNGDSSGQNEDDDQLILHTKPKRRHSMEFKGKSMKKRVNHRSSI